MTSRISRRTFLVTTATVGGGLALGLRLPPFGPAVVRAADGSPEITVWVVIRPDNTTAIRVVRAEMGQGTLTGLVQLVAEELECDWKKIVVEYPTPGESVKRKRAWGEFSTGGSRGIRQSNEYVRKGGAAARMMLVKAAADQWKVSPNECTASNSVITHGPSKRKVTFGQVAEAAAKLPQPTEVPLKDPKTWKIAGKSMKRLDTAMKVDGRMVYGMDLKLPGMLTAAIKECPVFGGKVKSFDANQVSGMTGVKKVVQVADNAVAVVADTYWHARTALEQLAISWDEGPNAKLSSADIAAQLKEGLDAEQAFVGNKAGGDVKQAIAGAAKKVDAVYSYPYQNHACMEPMNATVRWTPERCEMWGPTQNSEGAFAQVLAASGLPADKVDVHNVFLGGGFGRRGTYPDDYVVQAVLIAKQIPGTPVKMIWSREEDMAHGRYHPVMQCKMSGGLDANGELTALHMRISGQSILAAVRPEVLQAQKGRDPLSFQGVFESGEHSLNYTVPNLLVDHAMRNPAVPPGFWRGVNINQNAVFLESFIDELAEAGGKDPLEFRRKLLKDSPRALGVLNAVADKIEWSKPAPKGRYRGLAQMKAFDSYVAAACEISVTDGNKVKVHRIVAATDPGYAVNPDQIERQIAGSFVYGLSALFFQECTVKDGRIEQTNFHQYNSMRIAQMPKVEAILMPTGGAVWGGIGEPTICVAAPAVLNALAKAGKRIRSVPLKNHGIQMV
jgi:isoquinoline 1-oxidoreductase beta subunit